MDSRGRAFFMSTLLFTSALCFLAPGVKTQIDGCSVQGIDLQQCLDQSNGSMYIKTSCCKVLNQVVQAGFNCLCSLTRASSVGITSPPFALPLSNCYISVPPLSLCRDLAPLPVLLPPNSPKEPNTELSSPPTVLVSSPPQEVQVPPTNLTANNNSSIVSRQPNVNDEDDDPEVYVLNGAENSRIFLCQILLLSFCVFILVS